MTQERDQPCWRHLRCLQGLTLADIPQTAGLMSSGTLLTSLTAPHLVFLGAQGSPQMPKYFLAPGLLPAAPSAAMEGWLCVLPLL